MHDLFGVAAAVTSISAHVVQHTDAGSLSLAHQRLIPANAAQFAHLLDEVDHQLVRILGDITTTALVQKYAKGLSKAQTDKIFADGAKRDMAIAFVRKQVLAAFELLPGKRGFRMGKDNYPAARELAFSRDKASLSFLFKKTEAGTDYSLTVTHAGKELPLHKTPGQVVVDEPAWLQSGDLLFTFDEPVDGKRLRPFFAKPAIHIDTAREADFYEKFLARLLEQHSVTVDGIPMREVDAEPTFRLIVERPGETRYDFRLVAVYDSLELAPDPSRQAFVQTFSDGTNFGFRRVKRNPARERQVVESLQKLQSDANLLGFSMSQDKAVAWVGRNYPALRAAGIDVKQAFVGAKLPLYMPELTFDIEAIQEGYRVMPSLRLGPEVLDFALLRKALVNGDSLMRLPDDTHLPLPDGWGEQLRHFAEVAQPTPAGAWLLAPHHALLLPAILGEKAAEHPVAGTLTQFDSIEAQAAPKGLQATLRDYQQAGFDWLCFLSDYAFGGILADDMGLGKTLQTLALLQREKERAEAAGQERPRSLIVVPNSLVYNWLYEAEKFTPGLVIQVYAGDKRTRSETSLFGYDALITTYGMVRQDRETFAQHRWHYIILDESQYIKNRDAKTTQAVLTLISSRRLSLTGTPIENSTMDLWTQMHFLNRGLLGSERFFERFYAEPIERDANESRAEQLRKIVRPFVLRRTKQQVASELPPLIEQIIGCDMQADQHALYEANRLHYRNTFLAQSAADFEGNRMQILSSLQRLRQIAIDPRMVEAKAGRGGKYDVLMEQLEDLLAQGKKVLVFSQFVKLLQLIRADLNKKKIAYAYLDGSMPDLERAKQVAKFQEDADVPLFLMSIRAGGVGLNLTAAEYVLLMDPWWNPAVEKQAVARAHRIGQTNTVVVHKFITEGTIEEKILRLQERKAHIAGEIIRTEEQFFKELSREELLSLFD